MLLLCFLGIVHIDIQYRKYYDSALQMLKNQVDNLQQTKLLRNIRIEMKKSGAVQANDPELIEIITKEYFHHPKNNSKLELSEKLKL